MIGSAVEVFEKTARRLDALADDPVGLLTVLDSDEQRLRFPSVDLGLTWRIGSALRELAVRLELPVVASVLLGTQRAFHAALPGATADNDDWAARKSAVVSRYGRSSLAVDTQFRAAGKSFERDSRLPATDFAAHGGAFPLLVGPVGGATAAALSVGVVVVSGLPQRHDHALVVAVLAAVIGQHG